MSSNEFTGSPSSSVWLDVGTTVASPSGTADSVALGAHAANKAEPVTMPAALRKSRRERYCEYGVISEDLTGTDLNFVFMITSCSGCHCEPTGSNPSTIRRLLTCTACGASVVAKGSSQ